MTRGNTATPIHSDMHTEDIYNLPIATQSKKQLNFEEPDYADGSRASVSTDGEFNRGSSSEDGAYEGSSTSSSESTRTRRRKRVARERRAEEVHGDLSRNRDTPEGPKRKKRKRKSREAQLEEYYTTDYTSAGGSQEEEDITLRTKRTRTPKTRTPKKRTPKRNPEAEQLAKVKTQYTNLINELQTELAAMAEKKTAQAQEAQRAEAEREALRERSIKAVARAEAESEALRLEMERERNRIEMERQAMREAAEREQEHARAEVRRAEEKREAIRKEVEREVAQAKAALAAKHEELEREKARLRRELDAQRAELELQAKRKKAEEEQRKKAEQEQPKRNSPSKTPKRTKTRADPNYTPAPATPVKKTDDATADPAIQTSAATELAKMTPGADKSVPAYMDSPWHLSTPARSEDDEMKRTDSVSSHETTLMAQYVRETAQNADNPALYDTLWQVEKYTDLKVTFHQSPPHKTKPSNEEKKSTPPAPIQPPTKLPIRIVENEIPDWRDVRHIRLDQHMGNVTRTDAGDEVPEFAQASTGLRMIADNAWYYADYSEIAAVSHPPDDIIFRGWDATILPVQWPTIAAQCTAVTEEALMYRREVGRLLFAKNNKPSGRAWLTITTANSKLFNNVCLERALEKMISLRLRSEETIQIVLVNMDEPRFAELRVKPKTIFQQLLRKHPADYALSNPGFAITREHDLAAKIILDFISRIEIEAIEATILEGQAVSCPRVRCATITLKNIKDITYAADKQLWEAIVAWTGIPLGETAYTCKETTLYVFTNQRANLEAELTNRGIKVQYNPDVSEATEPSKDSTSIKPEPNAQPQLPQYYRISEPPEAPAPLQPPIPIPHINTGQDTYAEVAAAEGILAGVKLVGLKPAQFHRYAIQLGLDEIGIYYCPKMCMSPYWNRRQPDLNADLLMECQDKRREQALLAQRSIYIYGVSVAVVPMTEEEHRHLWKHEDDGTLQCYFCFEMPIPFHKRRECIWRNDYKYARCRRCGEWHPGPLRGGRFPPCPNKHLPERCIFCPGKHSLTSHWCPVIYRGVPRNTILENQRMCSIRAIKLNYREERPPRGQQRRSAASKPNRSNNQPYRDYRRKDSAAATAYQCCPNAQEGHRPDCPEYKGTRQDNTQAMHWQRVHKQRQQQMQEAFLPLEEDFPAPAPAATQQRQRRQQQQQQQQAATQRRQPAQRQQQPQAATQRRQPTQQQQQPQTANGRGDPKQRKATQYEVSWIN